MRKTTWLPLTIVVVAVMAPACATKKFVQTEVGNVNSKVETVTGSVEQIQSRIQQDEARIGQVDQKAEAAGQSAQQAQNTANAAAQAAQQVNTRVDQVAAEITSGRRLLYQVTLSEDQGNFVSGRAELPDEAKARIDQVIAQLKGQAGKDIYIEIEGHTDTTGTATSNYELGLERAEAVQRYIYTQHQIPLHKISVFSFGEEKPVAPNNTREGRAQNRRVVIRVLS
jgi:outer membrane protein OmpA-like peptidoglycan-associated protein